MSQDSIENLPSIDDYKSEELPSLDSILEEYKLPSVEDFKEKEEVVEEEKNTCGEGEYFCNDEQKCKPIPKGHKVLPDGELVKESQDLTEVLHLINAVRKDIPEIPEIRYYDDQLEQLSEHIEEVRTSLREEIPEIPQIPEIKYYDQDITCLQDRIDSIKEEIENLPEVKYYENDLQSLKEYIEGVKESIPVFPKWVNKVNEVPDFSWIGKTFSVIDDDFIKVNDHLNLLKGHIDTEVKQITETFDTKDFEARVDIKALTDDLKEAKDKIYKELKEAALKIWDHHDQFKDDDRKLKKQMLGRYNLLKENIEKQINEYNDRQSEVQKVLSDKFTEYCVDISEEISNLPEVKYYDEEIQSIKKDISPLSEELKELRGLIIDLKVKQSELQEGLLNIPPDEDNKDPLTPLDQNFVTLQELQSHYKLFVNRVTEQLATFGGGGAVELQYLDDITGIATNLSAYDGMYLTVDTSQAAGKNFKFASVSAGSTTWITNSTGIHTLSNVGIGTTNADTLLYVDGDATITGDLNVSGDIVYDEVDGRNLNITGIATINTLGVTGVTTVGILTSYTSISVGSTNLLDEIGTKSSIGMVMALG